MLFGESRLQFYASFNHQVLVKSLLKLNFFLIHGRGNETSVMCVTRSYSIRPLYILFSLLQDIKIWQNWTLFAFNSCHFFPLPILHWKISWCWILFLVDKISSSPYFLSICSCPHMPLANIFSRGCLFKHMGCCYQKHNRIANTKSEEETLARFQSTWRSYKNSR